MIRILYTNKKNIKKIFKNKEILINKKDNAILLINIKEGEEIAYVLLINNIVEEYIGKNIDIEECILSYLLFNDKICSININKCLSNNIFSYNVFNEDNKNNNFYLEFNKAGIFNIVDTNNNQYRYKISEDNLIKYGIYGIFSKYDNTNFYRQYFFRDLKSIIKELIKKIQDVNLLNYTDIIYKNYYENVMEFLYLGIKGDIKYNYECPYYKITPYVQEYVYKIYEEEKDNKDYCFNTNIKELTKENINGYRKYRRNKNISNLYRPAKYKKGLNWERSCIWNEPKYNNLSSYRYFYKLLSEPKKSNYFRSISIVDKYGIIIFQKYQNKKTIMLPYITYNITKAYIQRITYENSIKENYYKKEVILSSLFYNYGTKDGIYLFEIMREKAKGEGTSYFDDENYHDIFYVYQNLLRYADILTIKATEIILRKYSIKEILKINSYLLQIKDLDGISSEYNKKFLRKEIKKCLISGNIHKQLPKIIKDENNRRYQCEVEKIGLSKLEKTKLTSFIKKMKRYGDNIGLNSLLSYFPHEEIKKTIALERECIFHKEIFNLDLEKFCLFFKSFIQSKSSIAKKIYYYNKSSLNFEKIFNNAQSFVKINAAYKILTNYKVVIPEDIKKLFLFYGKIEEKCSPEFLMAGDASVCCMSFGTSYAKTYALEKGFGIYNIYYKNRVIANSVLWIDVNNKLLVVDNIEIAPNYIKFSNYIKQLYIIMINHIVKEYNLSGAIQGVGYNDLELYNSRKQKKRKIKLKAKEVINSYFYTDTSDGVYDII